MSDDVHVVVQPTDLPEDVEVEELQMTLSNGAVIEYKDQLTTTDGSPSTYPYVKFNERDVK